MKMCPFNPGIFITNGGYHYEKEATRNWFTPRTNGGLAGEWCFAAFSPRLPMRRSPPPTAAIWTLKNYHPSILTHPELILPACVSSWQPEQWDRPWKMARRERDRERGFMRVEERKRDSVEDRREKNRWRNESLRRSPFASNHGGRGGERWGLHRCWGRREGVRGISFFPSD